MARLQSSRHPAAPMHIKRPLNSFFLFRGELFKKLQRENPALVRGDFSAYASAKWHALSDEEKKVYELAAEKAKLLHQEQYPGYKYRPRRQRTDDEKKPKKKQKVKKSSQRAKSSAEADTRPAQDVLDLDFDDATAHLQHSPPPPAQSELQFTANSSEIFGGGTSAYKAAVPLAPSPFYTPPPPLETERRWGDAFLESHPRALPPPINEGNPKTSYEDSYSSSSPYGSSADVRFRGASGYAVQLENTNVPSLAGVQNHDQAGDTIPRTWGSSLSGWDKLDSELSNNVLELPNPNTSTGQQGTLQNDQLTLGDGDNPNHGLRSDFFQHQYPTSRNLDRQSPWDGNVRPQQTSSDAYFTSTWEHSGVLGTQSQDYSSLMPELHSNQTVGMVAYDNAAGQYASPSNTNEQVVHQTTWQDGYPPSEMLTYDGAIALSASLTSSNEQLLYQTPRANLFPSQAHTDVQNYDQQTQGTSTSQSDSRYLHAQWFEAQSGSGQTYTY